jgi:hypothetical protein
LITAAAWALETSRRGGYILAICCLRKRLRSGGWLVDVIPAAVVVFLPTTAGVLVNVAVVAGVHITAAGLSRETAAVRTGSGYRFAAT